jgi:hypothetical protein
MNLRGLGGKGSSLRLILKKPTTKSGGVLSRRSWRGMGSLLDGSSKPCVPSKEEGYALTLMGREPKISELSRG